MPQMGESIAEGTIVRWIKQVGDPIDKDEPLFEISTDKVDAEIPSPGAGVVVEIKVKEGETVPVNSVVAVIRDAGSAVVSKNGAAEAAPHVAAQAPPAHVTPGPQASASAAPPALGTPAPPAPVTPAPRAPVAPAPQVLVTEASRALRTSPLVRRIA